MTFFREELPRLGPDMDCCIGLELDPARRRLKIIAMSFSLLELVEIVRVACVTEWLLTTRWDKTVILELVFLVLLLVTNFLLYLGAIRRSATELLAWFVAHMLGLLIQVRDILMDIIMLTIPAQVLLIVYFVVVIFIIASPHSQNSWLGLPPGMGTNTSEFQQALRYHLGATITKLVALLVTAPLTAAAAREVWAEKERMEAEGRDRRAKYEVTAEYRDKAKLSTASQPSLVTAAPARRDSYGVYRDQAARRSYRRSHSSLSASEAVYTIPHTEATLLPPQGVVGPPMGLPQAAAGPPMGLSQDPGLGPGYRGAQHPNPPELWSRQTSLETSYNVPSLRTDPGTDLQRFPSIAEVTETRSQDSGWRNMGYGP